MPDFQERVVKIKVVGIGGAGNNVINRMIESGVDGVDFVVINTDKQDLNKSNCPNKLQIGEKLTGGMGAGSKPEIGRKAAEESRVAIAKVLENIDMVFITAGMGGGTGTGAAPIVADLAKEAGVLPVGVVTTPFKFEGANRMRQAEKGIEELHDKVDSLIVIPNDRLKYVTDQKITFANAFGIADDVLKQAVTSIAELVGFSDRVIINQDFADVSAVMKDAGRAHMGVGIATGREKAEQAALTAISSPLLETAITGATGVLVNVTGSRDLTLDEVETAAGIVQENANPDANIIFGATYSDEFEDEMRVTVIATGFEQKAEAKPAASPARPTAASTASAAPARPAATTSSDIDDIFNLFRR